MKFLLIISVFLFTACGEWFRQAPPATVGSGIPINSNPNYNPNNNPGTTQLSDPNGTETAPESTPDPIKDFGDVRCHSSQVTQFNQQVRNFLSTSFNPNQARYTIKCSNVPQWKGGFFLRGKVYFNGQKFDTQSSNQNLTVSPNSHLEIHIVDITGRPVTHGGQPIRMNIEPHASWIQGQDATLVFQDQNQQGKALGKVSLNGAVAPDQNNRLIFSGTFEFENFTAWNGSSQGLSGSLGTFKIPACRFLDCADSLPEAL